MILTKELTFDAAHRLMDYNGLCKNIHGHTFKLQVSIECFPLKDGMGIDFNVMKKLIKDWTDDNLDHSIILNEKDHEVITFCDNQGFRIATIQGEPTVENLSKIIFNSLSEIFVNQHINIIVKKITLWETPTSFCEYYV